MVGSLTRADAQPAATYSFEVNKMPLSVLVKWTQEFDAKNTFRGDTQLQILK